MASDRPSVLIITYYWPPAGGPGVQRWLKLAKYLSKSNCRVRVITVHPEKATWPVQDEALIGEVHPDIEVHYTTTFEPFGAYLKATGRKEVPFSGFANEVDKPGFRQRAAKFIRGNFFLPDARKGWNRFALKKAKELIAISRPDVVITTGPPHSTHLIGKQLKRLYDIQWIADFRDPWTDIYYYDSLYPTKLARAIDSGMEKSVLRLADAVLTSSPYLGEILRNKIGGDQKRFFFYPNGYDEADFPQPRPKPDEATLVYTGTLTSLYPLDALVQAMEDLEREGLKIHFRLFGRADEKQMNLLKSSAFRFTNEGFVDHSRAVREMCNAAVLLLVIPDQHPNRGIVPGKIFEYVGSGRPVLGIGPVEGDSANIIHGSGSGAFFAYDDAQGIANFLRSAIRVSTPESEEVQQYSRAAQANALIKIVAQLG